MAGETLESLETDEQIPEHTSVKEVVLPFDRLPGSDPRLGPEMKSTGEVMGTASDFGTAYWKAQQAADNAVGEGTAVVDLDVDGFENHFDVAAFDDVPQAIREGKVDFVVSRDRDSLEMAVEEEIPYLSTVASAEAYVEALESFDGELEVASVTDRPKRQARWGDAE
jgi:carbamoyl-phosphate synthase large subunit